MARAADQFRQSDVTFWGIVAVTVGGLALLAANVSALIPDSVLAGLHASRLDGASLNSVRAELNSVEDEQARIRATDKSLSDRFDMAEEKAGNVGRRISALEVSIPKLLEQVPPQKLIDDTTVTGSIAKPPVVSAKVVQEPLPQDLTTGAAVPAPVWTGAAAAPGPETAATTSPPLSVSASAAVTPVPVPTVLAAAAASASPAPQAPQVASIPLTAAARTNVLPSSAPATLLDPAPPPDSALARAPDLPPAPAASPSALFPTAVVTTPVAMPVPLAPTPPSTPMTVAPVSPAAAASLPVATPAPLAVAAVDDADVAPSASTVPAPGGPVPLAPLPETALHWASADAGSSTDPVSAGSTPTLGDPGPVNLSIFGVALGAPVDPSKATDAWHDLSARSGSLLSGLKPLLASDPAGSGGEVLVAGPLTTIVAAANLCGNFGPLGIVCTPMPYVGRPVASGTAP